MGKPSPRRLKKKKEREKQAKKKVLARRDAMRAPQIEENKQKKKMKRVLKLQKDMGDLNMWADDVLSRMSNDTLTQLEKNAKILKALEKEYEQELNKKKNLNNSLEEKGITSLHEKLNYLHNEFVEQQKSAGIQILDEEISLAEQAKTCNKNVAEVTVCKADDLEQKNEIGDKNQ